MLARLIDVICSTKANRNNRCRKLNVFDKDLDIFRKKVKYLANKHCR